MGKPKDMWLCRDESREGDSVYSFYFLKRGVKKGDKYFFGANAAFCVKGFQKATGFKLKPGEGPVKVKISVERV